MALPVLAIWQPLETGMTGTDLVRLEPVATGFRAVGVVAAREPDGAWGVRFELAIDSGWRTRVVDVESISAAGVVRRSLHSDGAGTWHEGPARLPELDGCIDVDLEATPFTNTLPIRRLALGVGEAADVHAAWVGVRGLALEPRAQRYERLAPDRYVYARPETGFRAELAVDAEGLVVEYEGLARRIY